MSLCFVYTRAYSKLPGSSGFGKTVEAKIKYQRNGEKYEYGGVLKNNKFSKAVMLFITYWYKFLGFSNVKIGVCNYES